MASGLENIETIESPFRRFVTTIGVFPTAFTDAMTYYECLAYLVKYLEETVIPAVNQNAEALAELQELYVQLKSYVDNYFANLDVQEEINNKLDQMAEDGTLQEIIADYIQSKVAWTFDTVAEMQSATNLIAGSYAQTLGRDNLNDGGEALYYITDTEPSTYYETIGSLYAVLIVPCTGLNIGAIAGDTLNAKFDNLRTYMTEYQYKKIVIPTSNSNNSACYTDLDGKSAWKVDAPIILGDEYNCCEIFVNDRVVATENVSSILVIAGSNKPENITFTGFLELLTTDVNSITVDCGLWIKESARVLFDTILVNYCDIGIQIGNGTSTHYATEVQANNMSVGYYKSKGIVLDSSLPLSIAIDNMQIAEPLASATHGLYVDCTSINQFHIGNFNLSSSSVCVPYGIYAINSRNTNKSYLYIDSIISNTFNDTLDYIRLEDSIKLVADFVRVSGNVKIYCDDTAFITLNEYQNYQNTSLYVKYGTAIINSITSAANITTAGGSGQNIIINGNPIATGVIKNIIRFNEGDNSVSTRIGNTTEYMLASTQNVSIDNVSPTLTNATITSSTCTVTSARTARIGDLKMLSANITTNSNLNAGATLLSGIIATSINLAGVTIGSTGQAVYKAYIEGGNLYAGESIPNGTTLRIGIAYC